MMLTKTRAVLPAPARTRLQKIGLLLPVLLLVQALALGLNPAGTAKAEGYSDPAFQQQWKLTDEAVATGKVSRTYFWGPQPFAHTKEVYAESPDNGQREVQYFDKARMELSKKAGQEANLVTNGLLTVELVSGQMQVGDTKFLQRSPATNPVAGDQVGNSLTPSYASFNQGKLAFGVTGATKASDRTGQPVNEAVNAFGEVSTLGQTPGNLKYARYFRETGHNVADVFNNFFQADPLGESKWLSVMGYPITEAFWAKDKVVVGGKSQDVLIQLFQRRALTYTPSNPAGYQVEMGNIGQHYYVWRYGFDTRDQLPGNYRLINPVGKTLYSTSIRKPSDKLNLGDAPSTITGLWILNEGRAIVAIDRKTYLADLTKARPFKEITPPTGDGLDPTKIAVERAVGSPDGKMVAIEFSSDNGKYVIQVYSVDTLSGDNTNVTGSYKAVASDATFSAPMSFSSDSRYLAIPRNDGISIFDNNERQAKMVSLVGQAYWLGQSNQLFVSTLVGNFYDPVSKTNKDIPSAKIILVDAASGSTKLLLEGEKIRQAMPSPDGNYFALRQAGEIATPIVFDGTNKSYLTFRAFLEPDKDLTPSFEEGIGGRTSSEPRIMDWGADGTYARIQSEAGGTAGSGSIQYNLVSLVNGKSLKEGGLSSGYMDVVKVQTTTLYTVEYVHTYMGPGAAAVETITLQNLDGSEKTVLFSAQNTLGQGAFTAPIRLAQVIEVPKV